MITSDIISVICEFILNIKDTSTISKLNKNIYENRNQYSLYDVNYKRINENNIYKIKGINCMELNNGIIKCVTEHNYINKIICERSLNHMDLINLPKNITSLNITPGEKTFRMIKYKQIIMSAANIKELSILSKCGEINLENCINIKKLEIYIEENTKILLPRILNSSNDFENIKINDFTIYCHDINYIKNFQYAHLVNAIYYDNNYKGDIYWNFDTTSKYVKLTKINVSCSAYILNFGIDSKNLLELEILMKNNVHFIEQKHIDINLPINISKIKLEIKDYSQDVPILIHYIPQNVKHFEYISNNIPYIRQYAKHNTMKYIKFVGRQVQFKINNIDNLVVENCAVNLSCYSNIGNLTVKDCTFCGFYKNINGKICTNDDLKYLDKLRFHKKYNLKKKFESIN